MSSDPSLLLSLTSNERSMPKAPSTTAVVNEFKLFDDVMGKSHKIKDGITFHNVYDALPLYEDAKYKDIPREFHMIFTLKSRLGNYEGSVAFDFEKTMQCSKESNKQVKYKATLITTAGDQWDLGKFTIIPVIKDNSQILPRSRQNVGNRKIMFWFECILRFAESFKNHILKNSNVYTIYTPKKIMVCVDSDQMFFFRSLGFIRTGKTSQMTRTLN